ncbi:MAG: M15 family metallopeptidase [Chloroflexi bacterium]|nr:M15 family metallopeptidase [Chloroflexota bacterium]
MNKPNLVAWMPIFTIITGLILTACGTPSISIETSPPTTSTQSAPIEATPIAYSSPTPTPQASATPSPPSPTPTTEITIFNIYIGKDTLRQPELIETPLAEIVSINTLENFSGNFIDIFLEGKAVNGEPIRGSYEMLEQLTLLFEAAWQNGFISQTIYSSYRTLEDQQYLIASGESGSTQDTGLFLAPPGRSEHQLGTAIDLGWGTLLLDFFSIYNNPTAGEFYNWLQENAHNFGFVISYPPKMNADGTTSNIFEAWITEFKAEPWHLRYLGVEYATQIYNYQDDQNRNYLDPFSEIIPQQFYLP